MQRVNLAIALALNPDVLLLDGINLFFFFFSLAIIQNGFRLTRHYNRAHFSPRSRISSTSRKDIEIKNMCVDYARR
jgi:hypothetical protein